MKLYRNFCDVTTHMIELYQIYNMIPSNKTTYECSHGSESRVSRNMNETSSLIVSRVSVSFAISLDFSNAVSIQKSNGVECKTLRW